LPYSGLGSGIQRVERLYPEVEWVNEQEKEEFCVTFFAIKQITLIMLRFIVKSSLDKINSSSSYRLRQAKIRNL
jgi:hypothetical protein